jgi:GR25 family glycosyltransferase involved in LPS biosynthesis
MAIPIEVISLRASTQRREAFARENAHLAYAFHDACDGAALAAAQLEDPRHFVQPLPFPSRGAYGCALSHLALWDAAIERQQALTVAEDDAVFRLDFAAASQALLARLPADWDLVLWGWNFDSVLAVRSLAGVTPVAMAFSQDLLRQNIEAFRCLAAPADPLPLERAFGLPAYTISAAGARRFRQACFPLRDFSLFVPGLGRRVPNRGIDVAMARAYPETRSFAAFPPLVATRNERAASTIQA